MKTFSIFSLALFLLFSITACVETEEVPEILQSKIILQTESINLLVNQTTTLNAIFTDEKGVDRSNELQWRSTNPAVASVAASGIVTALTTGQARIVVTHGSLSDSTLVTVSTISTPTQPIDTTTIVSAKRSGTFKGNHSYSVKGTAVLQSQGDSLQLVFQSDFVSSNGPQLAVYLAKNAPGVLTASNSVNLGALKSTSGAQTYIVPANVKLADYDFAVVYCIPFNVAFGFAKLQ